MIATFVGFALALLGEFAFEKIKSLVDSTALLRLERTISNNLDKNGWTFSPYYFRVSNL